MAAADFLEDEKYDTTLLLTVLHHSDDPFKTIKEAKSSGDWMRSQIASKAAKYLENLDIEKRNLDTVRIQIINFLLKLERKDK